MMSTTTTHKEKTGVKNLQSSLKRLVEKYKHAHSLLEQEMQAVVEGDISALNRLVEQQVAAYDMLKKAEETFKKQLQSFHHLLNDGQLLSLQNVITVMQEPENSLQLLRDKLRDEVVKTEQLQKQVMNLIQFARKQNTELFKSICTLANDGSEGYDSKGKKMNPRPNGLAVNQQA